MRAKLTAVRLPVPGLGKPHSDPRQEAERILMGEESS